MRANEAQVRGGSKPGGRRTLGAVQRPCGRSVLSMAGGEGMRVSTSEMRSERRQDLECQGS